MSWLENFKYRIRTEKPKQMQRLDDNTYYGGNLIILSKRDNFSEGDARFKQGGRLIRKFQNAGYIDYPVNQFLHNYGAAIQPKIDQLADKAEVYADGISTLGSGIGTVGVVTGNPILSGIGIVSQVPNGIIDLYQFLRGINKKDVEQSAINGVEFGLDLLGGKIFSKTFKPTFKPTVGSLFRSNHHSPRVRKLMDYYGKQEESKLRSKVIRDLKKRGVRKSQGQYFDTKFKERFIKEMERKAQNKNDFFEPLNKGIVGVANTLANFGMLNMHLNRNDENN